MFLIAQFQHFPCSLTGASTGTPVLTDCIMLRGSLNSRLLAGAVFGHPEQGEYSPNDVVFEWFDEFN